MSNCINKNVEKILKFQNLKTMSDKEISKEPKKIKKSNGGNAHYEKYKETIKRVSRRNYRKRITLLNEILNNKSCVHCGESETMCLKFYPHDLKIRRITKNVGTNDKSRQEVFHLINESKVLCLNCYIKANNDLIEFI